VGDIRFKRPSPPTIRLIRNQTIGRSASRRRAENQSKAKKDKQTEAK